MKYHLAWNLLLLFNGFLMPHAALAQEDPWNLGFEQLSPWIQQFSPWVKTYYDSSRRYTIAPDSTTVQQGRYSLRMHYTPEGPNRSDAQVINTITLDVPCKTLTVSFYAKLTGPLKDCFMGFYAAQDRAEKKLESKTFKIAESADWVQYSGEIDMTKLTFPIDHLRISGYYKGEGSLWLDNFTILADGQPLQETTSFCAPADEKIRPLTRHQVDRLALLGKTWGFLKYYHPEVAKGKFYWDGELFRLIPVAKSIASDAAFSDSLLHWINTLGAVKACDSCTDAPPQNALADPNDLAWMKDKRFSPALQEKLHYLLINRHKGFSYYVSNNNNLGNAQFQNEQEYRWRHGYYPKENFRLLTLFRYWNMIHYFYPYKNILDRKWNDVLYTFLPRMAEAKDSLAYNTAVLQLITSVDDSHASSYNPVVARQYEQYLPVRTYLIKDQLIVMDYYNDSLAALAGLQKGDVIEKIDGRPVKELIAGKKTLMPASNHPTTLRNLSEQNIIAGGKSPRATLTVSRNGRSFTREVQRYTFKTFRYKYKRDSIYWKILPGNIGYVNMGLLERTQVDSMMQALKNTHSIVFDIRNYPRQTLWPIADYLFEKPVLMAYFTFPNLDYPGAFSWGRNGNYLRPQKKSFRYTGKIVILVNELSQSQAEFATMGLQSVPGSYTIGSQTAGADGNSAMLYLPGGYGTYMTGLGVFYPDKTPTQRIGVKVDKTVVPTPAGIAAGKDEVLEAAVEYIQKKNL